MGHLRKASTRSVVISISTSLQSCFRGSPCRLPKAHSNQRDCCLRTRVPTWASEHQRLRREALVGRADDEEEERIGSICWPRWPMDVQRRRRWWWLIVRSGSVTMCARQSVRVATGFLWKRNAWHHRSGLAASGYFSAHPPPQPGFSAVHGASGPVGPAHIPQLLTAPPTRHHTLESPGVQAWALAARITEQSSERALWPAA